MLLVVPHEGADALVALDAERPQAVRQPRGVVGDLDEAGPPVASITDGDDRAVAVDVAAVAEDRRDRQRDVLHRASHAVIVL